MESESEKKRNGTANQTPRKSPEVRESRPHFPRAACRASSSIPVHGTRAARRMGTKNQNGSWRPCTLVRYRSRCSRMKKKSKKSGLVRQTTQNHGTVSAR